MFMPRFRYRKGCYKLYVSSTVNLFIHYEYWFTALGPDYRRYTNTAIEQISMVGEGFKRIQRLILTLPKYADRGTFLIAARQHPCLQVLQHVGKRSRSVRIESVTNAF